MLASCGGKRPYEQFKKVRTPQEVASTTQPAKAIKKMNLEEALEAYAYYDQEGRDDLLMKVIPHIITLSSDVHQIANLTLELADIHMGSGDFDAAQKLYDTFIDKYPGHEKIKDARYRQIVALWWRSLEPDRDQSLTRSMVTAARSYLRDFKEHDEQRTKVQALVALAYEKLMVHELQIAQFYVNRGDLAATQARLTYLNKEVAKPGARYDKKLKMLHDELVELEAWSESEHTQEEKSERFSTLIDTYTTADVQPRDIF